MRKRNWLVEQYEHDWIDVSRHGSPTWKCSWCGVHKWDAESEICPEAENDLTARERREISREKRKHWDMLFQVKRFVELHEKYGDESIAELLGVDK